MKKLLTILLTTMFLLPLITSGQVENNTGWITYDSAIQTTADGLHFHQYTFRMTRPPNGDTAKRISIWMMPGEGENGGTNTAKLIVWGPHFWLNGGWDGGVTLLSGGKRYPILITCISDQTAPYAEDNLLFMDYMVAHYNIRPGAIHVTGLSAGSWAWTTMINYQRSSGSEEGMKRITSVLALSGFATNALYQGDQTPPYQIGLTAWGHWAKKYKGHYFGLQGSSDGVNGIYLGQQRMDDSTSGQGYFSYENIGGGAHCCWNSMYDPSAIHWNSTGTRGPNNVTGAQPNAMGTYVDGENLFTWEVMQGDTTAVGAAALPTVSAGTNQTIALPTSSVSLSGSATANAPAISISGYLWTQVSGPNTGVFGNAVLASTTFSGLIAGTYVLNLRATDNNGNQNNAQVTITVNAATPPTVNAGSNQTIFLPTTSTSLSGSATPHSPAISISSYAWIQLSGPNAGTFSNTAIANPTFSSLVVGTYTLRLSATDNNGNVGTSQMTVSVAPAPANSCRAYYWDSTNIGIALTNANYPSINPCDTIYIDPCKTQAGYRSLTIKLTAGTPWKYSTLDSNRINIIFRNAGTYGTIKTNSSGNLFANSIDASNNLLIKGLKMNDHTDPLFSTVTPTGYLHHIKFVDDTLQNIPGLWGSGPITTSLPNFTGNHDTTNCNYDIWFHHCIFDSTGNTSFGGLVAIWLGGFTQNQVFVKTEIDSSLFNYAPSPTGSGPACFVHCQQCYFIKIHDNVVTNLGVVTNPQGHAASFFMQASLFDIYHNFFKGNFSNGTRAISSATVPGMTSLFTAWDPTYDGVGRFWGNILDSGRKYPMIESQKDTIAIASLPYAVAVRSPRVWNNTMYRGGTGKGNQPYNVSVYDWYQVAYTSDTIEMHNNVEIGPPTDTTSGVFCYSTYCYSLLTRPSGTTAYYDTSGNQFYQLMTFGTSGLADTTGLPNVGFYPLTTGILYNNGIAVPAWLTTDFHHNPIPATGRAAFNRNTGVDVGASQALSPNPIVNAGFNQIVVLPLTFTTLSGTATAQNAATIASVLWTQVSGPNTATISSPTTNATPISGLIPGTYVFQFSATDNNGLIGTSRMQVLVTNGIPLGLAHPTGTHRKFKSN